MFHNEQVLCTTKNIYYATQRKFCYERAPGRGGVESSGAHRLSPLVLEPQNRLDYIIYLEYLFVY